MTKAKTDPIAAAIKAAEARRDAAPKGSNAHANACADLAAAERIQRDARRAAGEALVPEEQRDRPVTFGDLEDVMAAVKSGFGTLKGRVAALERKNKKGSAQ